MAGEIEGKLTLDDKCIVEVNSDPRIIINKNCPISSIAVWNNGGLPRFFIKYGPLINDWQVANLDEYLSIYLSTAAVDVPLTPMTIPYNVVRENQNTNVFSPNTTTGEITVLKTGKYLLSVDGSINKSVGNNIASCRFWIEKNGVEVPSSHFHTSASISGDFKSCSLCNLPLSLAVNDVIRVRTMKIDLAGGTQNLALDHDANRLFLTRIFQ